MKHLEIVMIGEPKGNEFLDLRKTGRGLGVRVGNPESFQPHAARFLQDAAGTPVYALETWQGPKAHDLSTFQFPERMVLITGTTNRGLDDEWREVVDGSIYIPSRDLLSVPAAGAMVMWEWFKQGGVR